MLDRGPRPGLLVIAGTGAGLLCHATLAGLGLSALVMRSSTAFSVVKLLGAAYLVGLGARTLWRSRGRAGAPGTPALPPVRPLPWAGRGDLVQGLLGNVLNPKAAAVYLTLAPQFLPAGQSVLPAMLALGAAHLVVAAGWLVVWTCVVSASRRTLASHRFRRVLDRISGAVLIGLGLRTAAAAR